jgi:flagellar hook assembly protein FlgD
VTSTPAPVDTRVPDGIFGATHNSFLGGSQTVTFFYEVPSPSPVHLSIVNVLGHRVRELVNEARPTGVSSIDWDGRNDQGTMVAEDVYFILLKVGDRVVLRKVGVRHDPR